MRTGVTLPLCPTDRKRPRTIVDDRNGAQKHVLVMRSATDKDGGVV